MYYYIIICQCVYYIIFHLRRYKTGSVIDVTVKLTAAHLGWFEFNLCPLKTNKELETDKCFDMYPLPRADGKGYKYPIAINVAKDYTISLVLPKNVTCKQCVLRLVLKTISFCLILTLLIRNFKSIINIKKYYFI